MIPAPAYNEIETIDYKKQTFFNAPTLNFQHIPLL